LEGNLSVCWGEGGGEERQPEGDRETELLRDRKRDRDREGDSEGAPLARAMLWIRGPSMRLVFVSFIRIDLNAIHAPL
jgi:hypothetical protein